MDYLVGDRVNFRLDGDRNNVKEGTVITGETDDGDFNVEYTDDSGEKKIIAFNRSFMPSGFKNIDAGDRHAKLPTRPPNPESDFQRFGRAMDDPQAYLMAEYQKIVMPYAIAGSTVLLFWYYY